MICLNHYVRSACADKNVSPINGHSAHIPEGANE